MAVSRTDIIFANATTAEFQLNGGTSRTVIPRELAGILSDIREGEVSLMLINASQKNATPVTRSYSISFRIASSEDLRNVETVFFEKITNLDLTRASIDEFVNDKRCSGLGADYAIALASYTLGILLKERPAAERLTTPFARYRESYGVALEALSEFTRPLARMISEIIRFALNEFTLTSRATGFWELDLSKSLLTNSDWKSLPPAPDLTRSRRKICPVDHGTGQILDLAVRMSRQLRWSPILDDECRRVAISEKLDVMDQQKALAIWAIAAWRLGGRDSALEPLKQISATYPFSTWADAYLEAVTQ
jgi:hypothetical protein